MEESSAERAELEYERLQALNKKMAPEMKKAARRRTYNAAVKWQHVMLALMVVGFISILVSFFFPIGFLGAGILSCAAGGVGSIVTGCLRDYIGSDL